MSYTEKKKFETLDYLLAQMISDPYVLIKARPSEDPEDLFTLVADAGNGVNSVSMMAGILAAALEEVTGKELPRDIWHSINSLPGGPMEASGMTDDIESYYEDQNEE